MPKYVKAGKFMNYCSICGKELPEGLSVCPDHEPDAVAEQAKDKRVPSEKPKKKKKKSSKARFDFDAAVRKADELFEGIEIGDSIFGEEEKPKTVPSREKEIKAEDKVGFSVEELLKKAEKETEKPAERSIVDSKPVLLSKAVFETSRVSEPPLNAEKPARKTAETEEKPKPAEKLAKEKSTNEKKPFVEQSDLNILDEKKNDSEVSEKVLRLFEPLEEEAEEKLQKPTKEVKHKLFTKKEAEKKTVDEEATVIEVSEKPSKEKVTLGERLSALIKNIKKLFFEDTEQPSESSDENLAATAKKEPKTEDGKETVKDSKQTEAKKTEAADENNEKSESADATLFDLDVKDEKVKLTAKKREREGILERELEEKEGDEEQDKRYGKAVITAAAVIVALLVGLFVYAAATAAKGEPIETGGVMLEYLTGEWISERYSYEEDGTVLCRELLTVNEDETFKMVYYIDDGNNSEGYLDGTWKIREQMSGIVAFDENDSSVHLRFSQNGQNQEYVRYLLNTTDETMTLREYYNKAKTDFFDVEFTKIQ